MLNDLISDEKIKELMAKAVESKLSQAVADATGEAVERLIGARVQGAFGQFGFQNDLQKAQKQNPAQLDQAAESKGLLYDPFTALDQMGFRERPSSVSFGKLYEMARRVPPFAAYLQTRINQMAAFCESQPDEHSVGFKITVKDKNLDLDKKLQKRADELTEWLRYCGDPALKNRRDKFGHWMRKSVRDSLIADQWCTEIIPLKNNSGPAYFRALDASTIRIADTLDEITLADDSIQYVQIYDETIIAEFTDDELAFGVRNPNSDIRWSGYGMPELEMLISVVTALLWGIDYNAKFFSQGSVAKGLLNFKGAVPEKELSSFRRNWYAMITGVQNAWKTPVVNAEDVQWINMQSSNRDMEFASWIDWLLKVTCSVCQIAPEEIGFQFGNGGQSGSLNEGSQADKLASSKDKGLVPLAKHFAEHLNEKIITKLDDRFKLEFVGLNARTAEGLIDLQTKEVKSVKTINEIRKARGDEPLAGKLGDIILDPTFLQWAQAQAQEQAQGQGGDGQPPNAPEMDQSSPWQDEEDDVDNQQQQWDEDEQETQKSFGLHANQKRAMRKMKFEVKL